ncbi:hypothetical protein [Pseudomethylobacillus aquaticus]|uniref:hypothetical protein n=1 Tax=Pseudomethylobacillus aquaticus TaxID=2676064 RepID=UPI0011CD810B|nr:hypothetical protein [Pseudomethylobacillus aquaticus]
MKPSLHFFAPLLVLLLISPLAVHAEPRCNTPEGAATVNSEVEAELQTIKEKQRNTEAGIDKDLDAKAEEKNWSKEQRSAFVVGILKSAEFRAFEQEKKPYTEEITALMTAPLDRSDTKASCLSVSKLQAIVRKIDAINVRQYGYLSAQVKAAK